jgi:hypothetical protein
MFPAGDAISQIRQFLTRMKQLRVSLRAGREYSSSEEYVEHKFHLLFFVPALPRYIQQFDVDRAAWQRMEDGSIAIL